MTLFARLLTAAFVLMLASPAFAQVQGTKARAALVIDVASGAILLEKNADKPLPPASMSKLMTLFMAFEALEKGVISMEEKFPVSRHASSMKGSSMFLRQGEKVSVENLIRGVVVQSGNDAAVVLAELMAGTEEVFAARMNRRAAELGMTNSSFANATGWPHPKQRMSVRDLATLAELIVTRFPEQYKIFAETKFTWDNIPQTNRNPLLGRGLGADGLKTGHTKEAGYGLVASATRDGRRIIVVVSGLATKEDRLYEAEQLVQWAFRAFETRQLYKKGQALAQQANVWLGATKTVPIAPTRDVIITAPFGTLHKAQVVLRYDGPVPAPIAPGTKIGQIEIRVPDLPPVLVPVAAAAAVDHGGFMTRVEAVARILLAEIHPALAR